MEAEIKPVEKIEILKENLRKRVEKIEEKDEKLFVELENTSKLQRVPGIESFKVNGEKREGLKGSPVEEPVYARLESKKDAVKCLIATIEGYDLRILNSGREWDIRQLKRYNPDIKHLKFEKPRKELKIEKSLSKNDSLDTVDIEVPEKQEEIEEIYREMLT